MLLRVRAAAEEMKSFKRKTCGRRHEANPPHIASLTDHFFDCDSILQALHKKMLAIFFSFVCDV